MEKIMKKFYYFFILVMSTVIISCTEDSSTDPETNSQITVTSPYGGESWAHNSTHEITWTDNISGNVRIELWEGTRLETNIASTASDGSFS